MCRMRSVLVLAAVVLLSSAAGPAAATASDWSYTFYCMSTLQVGTCTGAADALDAHDTVMPDTWRFPLPILVWTDYGSTRLTGDYRAPLALNQTQTWTVKVAPRVTLPSSRNFIFICSSGAADSPTEGPPGNWNISLTLTGMPTGSSYSGPMSWNLSSGQSATASLPMGYPGYGSSLYTFSFSVHAVPEPASLAGLSVALIGAMLLRWRRKAAYLAATSQYSFSSRMNSR